jgi:hypothetical protein
VPHLRKLKFEVRFAIEQRVASGDLEWSDLTEPLLEQLHAQSNDFGKAVVVLTRIATTKDTGGKGRSCEALTLDELRCALIHHYRSLLLFTCGAQTGLTCCVACSDEEGRQTQREEDLLRGAQVDGLEEPGHRHQLPR